MIIKLVAPLKNQLIWQDCFFRLQLTFVNLVRNYKEIWNTATHVMNNDGDINTTGPKRSQQVTHDTLVRVLTNKVTTINNDELSSFYENEAELKGVGREKVTTTVIARK